MTDFPRRTLPQVCVTCRYWGAPGDGLSMRQHCREEANLRELGELLRAMWETCARWVERP